MFLRTRSELEPSFIDVGFVDVRVRMCILWVWVCVRPDNQPCVYAPFLSTIAGRVQCCKQVWSFLSRRYVHNWRSLVMFCFILEILISQSRMASILVGSGYDNEGSVSRSSPPASFSKSPTASFSQSPTASFSQVPTASFSSASSSQLPLVSFSKSTSASYSQTPPTRRTPKVCVSNFDK